MIFVTGVSGQVGGEIQRLFPEAIFLTRTDVDLSSEESIRTYFSGKKVDLIVNCAAYTQVDLAEKEQALAFKINSEAPAILASISKKFIHFSTDYVFNGTGTKPYLETDLTGPTGVYGQTKLEGEKAVLKANPASVIIRTSWVYSDLGKNFVKTMLRLGKEKEELRVVSDQIGSPTYARDLAQIVVDHGIKSWNFNSGIYHFSNEGVISWAGFAEEIMNQAGLHCKIMPIPTNEYPTPAKRPAYSVLDKTKIKNELNITIPHWKESLKACLQKLS